ncbi:Very-long-chain 3-oxoacyl-CoA reductase [Zancudomyces culisetae]|uniref:Very-long-chain 3-oxoacyl-CoA reductase n=1 Tax=Zancudomyces culisetae TaxID=1213189 RepID=A0A1R1PKG6_ZANCU|nr:Very-long-chain 3-oxoacyl-CoA reductase [Zancudomyces culisetae]|eukprot:OMH81413.1 Very-long-chain 3-oxoacyl-CoA reductase [Zancudomyces culisetae]
MFVDLFISPSKKLSALGAGKGAWAIVTGSTDGIGKGFAEELARNKVNLVLISRSQDKLDAVAKEIKNESKVQVKTIRVDFANATKEDYERVKKEIQPLNVTMLFNNAGVSHEYPKEFEIEDDERNRQILEVNVNALTKMSRLVAEKFKAQKNGLIVNTGSFSALVPSPFLAFYSGSKSFVQAYSQAIGAELEPFNVSVIYLNTYFVCSKLSKVRKSNFFTPTPEQYAKQVLYRLGSHCGSLQPFVSVPHVGHAIANFAIENILNRRFWISYSYRTHTDIKRRALAKQKRLADEASKKSK